MINISKKNNLYNLLTNLSIGILLIYFFYKLNFQSFIPISGDELNSILIYSTNIKTLFLKNFPGNVTLFHFLGYLKSLLFGYDLIAYRALTFIFLILHFWVLKKMNYESNFSLIFLTLIVLSYVSFYAGQYSGYIFSSFIFCLIFYFIRDNLFEKYIKIIFFLLFIQIYNHLVNLYLAIPIILSLFIFCNKIKFFKHFFLYFILPLIFFYSLSSVLTGLAVSKVPNTNLKYVSTFFVENYSDIISNGFDRIFFYEAYANAKQFNISTFSINLFHFDKLFFIFFFLNLVFSILNIKIRKFNPIFSYIIIIHFLIFFVINKDPSGRIFSGFYCFYIFLIFEVIDKTPYLKKYIKLNLYYYLFLSISIITIFNFNYLKTIKLNKNFNDFNFVENEISINELKKDCLLINRNFSEIQRRNFYYNYLNICNQKFNLNEFLSYYRS